MPHRRRRHRARPATLNLMVPWTLSARLPCGASARKRRSARRRRRRRRRQRRRRQRAAAISARGPLAAGRRGALLPGCASQFVGRLRSQRDVVVCCGCVEDTSSSGSAMFEGPTKCTRDVSQQCCLLGFLGHGSGQCALASTQAVIVYGSGPRHLQQHVTVVATALVTCPVGLPQNLAEAGAACPSSSCLRRQQLRSTCTMQRCVDSGPWR